MNGFTESMPHRIRIHLPVAAKHIGKYICLHISLVGGGKMNVSTVRR